MNKDLILQEYEFNPPNQFVFNLSRNFIYNLIDNGIENFEITPSAESIILKRWDLRCGL